MSDIGVRLRHRQCLPYLAGLVLRDLVLGVLLAVLALAVGAAGLGNVDLKQPSVSYLWIFLHGVSLADSTTSSFRPSRTPR